MIGFTPDGRTKVWFNENYGMNYPSRPNKRLEKSREGSYLNQQHQNFI